MLAPRGVLEGVRAEGRKNQSPEGEPGLTSGTLYKFCVLLKKILPIEFLKNLFVQKLKGVSFSETVLREYRPGDFV